MTLNKVQLIGNLGADPELKMTNNQKSVCNISIGTSKKYKDRNEQWQEKTEWHRVQLWNKTAENAAKYLSKGSKVYVEGELQTRSYDKDGTTKYTTEIVATSIIFLDSKTTNKTNNQMQAEDPPRSERDAYMSGGNDVPF